VWRTPLAVSASAPITEFGGVCVQPRALGAVLPDTPRIFCFALDNRTNGQVGLQALGAALTAGAPAGQAQAKAVAAATIDVSLAVLVLATAKSFAALLESRSA
jgi:hypothetical protein